jgi:hypothetical protein
MTLADGDLTAFIHANTEVLSPYLFHYPLACGYWGMFWILAV